MNKTRTAWAGILLRRAIQIVALGLLVGAVCFFMARSLPGDMATRIAAGRYGYDLVNNAAADAVRIELGLDRPLWLALLAWWGDIARLDLGTSLVTGASVWREVAHQLGATIDLAVASVFIAAIVGLPLGIWSGLHAGGWIDRLTLALAVVLRALPPFLLAVLLMVLVAVRLGALPVAGDDHAAGLLLPALTLGLGLAAGLARVARAAMREAAASASFEFARTKGLSDRQALLRHGLRQAAAPVVAYLGVHAVFLVEGAVVVETLFAWPGIGHALVHAVFGRDVPMIQGTALCMGLLFVVFNLLVDAACLALDPRRRMGVDA
ncbi:peptide/nickel transport system permease protein [Variovorax boronicumulans]|uniref:ABC transporter permease n=1 Tax=Variovorax boronicumulans TaxID=436515 RepID=UPI00247654DF|nr:ABC transporter permease [Variovorax boronicumulans]MDH6165461.1 peptide/nickel transport system permease protein [Variovorax boronicumulans]